MENQNTLIKIGYILKLYRNEKNISQMEMAELLKISVRNYQRLENGEVEPKLDTLKKICDCLALPVSTLLDWPTVKVAGIEEFLTKQEIARFLELLETPDNHDKNDELTRLVSKLILESDFELPRIEEKYIFEIRGIQASFCDRFKLRYGLKTNTINLDDYIVNGKIAERWEIIHRNKILTPVTEVALNLPNGIRIFKACHFCVNSNPDAPCSKSYYFDITDAVCLHTWIKKNLGTLPDSN